MQTSDILQDHETRIGKLEVKEAVNESKLDTTNRILAAIAVMIGGSLVTFLFKLL